MAEDCNFRHDRNKKEQFIDIFHVSLIWRGSWMKEFKSSGLSIAILSTG